MRNSEHPKSVKLSEFEGRKPGIYRCSHQMMRRTGRMVVLCKIKRFFFSDFYVIYRRPLHLPDSLLIDVYLYVIASS